MQCGCPDQGLGEARGRRAQTLGQGGAWGSGLLGLREVGAGAWDPRFGR